VHIRTSQVKQHGFSPSRIHAFADTARFAQQLGRAVGASVARVRVHRFPDGESLVRIRPPAGDCAVLVRSLHDPNVKLVETLLAADALRRAGARRVILVAPYLPYMRQDTVFTPGEPISQRVIGGCLGHAFDCVLSIEAHLHRVRHLHDVVPCQARSLSAARAPAGVDPLRAIADECAGVSSRPSALPFCRRAGEDAGEFSGFCTSRFNLYTCVVNTRSTVLWVATATSIGCLAASSISLTSLLNARRSVALRCN